MNKNRMRRPTVWGELACDSEAPSGVVGMHEREAADTFVQ